MHDGYGGNRSTRSKVAVYRKIYGMTVGEEDMTDRCPVYILGAGFFKTIYDEMPLLDAL